MPPKCPSCKGKMETQSPNYVCRSCGLVINRYEFDKTKRDHFAGRKDNEDDDHYEKQKKNREYLEWLQSSDKDSYDD